VESSTATDAFNAAATFEALIQEFGSVTDVVFVTQVFMCAIQETVTASDSFFARFLWELINDSQTANWGNINTSESTTWATINAAQTAGWATINTSESTTWVIINDSNPNTWTEIGTT
jgi:hypothetical protein